jgi:NADPH:quinone reductase-like Zn-dependent oxidoreductase
MVPMKAAIVRSFQESPAYEEFETPVPTDGEMLIKVLAAGLHNRVRTSARGSHYTSTGQLPMIPGLDGIGTGPDGELRYFVLHDTRFGSLAEKVVIDPRASVVLPPGTDVLAVAAAMNPAMGSWIALRKRIAFEEGQKVLVLGATGNSGQMAVQIAKRLGAGQVTAVGRNQGRLDDLVHLGADRTVSLTGDPDDVEAELGAAAADADVVLDFLWGEATQFVMPAVLKHRADDAADLTWVQIGSMAGLEITIPSAWLRAVRITIIGSGQGSVSPKEIVADMRALAAEITSGSNAIVPCPKPLSEVREAWDAAVEAGQRIVFVP